MDPIAAATPAASSPAPLVQSSRDLIDSAPADLFDGIESTPDPQGDDTPDSEPETFETPDEIAAPEPEAPEPATESKPADKPVDEELPEGVKKGKDRNGKDGFFLEKNRYETIHGNHKMVQQLSEELGEPATFEALELRNRAFLGQERLFNDMNSGDAKAQGNVIGHFFDQMAEAQKNGEVGVDPSISFAKAFAETLESRSPEAHAQTRLKYAADLITEMFHEAAASDDKPLFLSAQHMARKLAGFGADAADMASVRAAAQKMGIPIHTWDEAPNLKAGPKSDPLAAAQARIKQLESKVGQPNDQAAQFKSWAEATNKTIYSGIREAIKPALAGVADGWKDFPNEYKELVEDRLHSKVEAVLKSDDKFQAKITDLKARAKQAVSAQVRTDIATRIKTAYENRAKQAVDGEKGPILAFAATTLKAKSDQTHERKSNAQAHTNPQGPGGNVPRSLLPKDVGIPAMSGGIFDPKVAMKQMQGVLPR